MVNVIVRDSVLLGDQDGTGWVEGHGSVPGDLIRQWIADNLDAGSRSGSAGSTNSPPPATWSPWTPAPSCSRAGSPSSSASATASAAPSVATHLIRHTDHVVPRARGGPTTADNGQGLCELCNYAKEADGWSARTIPGPRHTVEITTPTGHTYSSTADPL